MELLEWVLRGGGLLEVPRWSKMLRGLDASTSRNTAALATLPYIFSIDEFHGLTSRNRCTNINTNLYILDYSAQSYNFRGKETRSSVLSKGSLPCMAT